MDLKAQMDRIYESLPLAEIPWNSEQPPDLLVNLVASRWVSPCDAVDLGCGAGNYAIWLATRGFRMTGLDLSPKAIELAELLAARQNIPCRFLVANLAREFDALDGSFDFAYDWEVLHHVFPEDREQFTTNIHRMLRPGGRYLSLCFSEEDDSGFEGEGKYRTTPLGTTLYFSSERELERLFGSLFRIAELSTVEIAGKYRPHKAVKALLVKSSES